MFVMILLLHLLLCVSIDATECGILVKVKYAYTFSIFEPFHLVDDDDDDDDSSPFTKVPSQKILLYFDALCFFAQ